MIRPGGYTLLEMVVVVALLALATGMVAPAGYRMLASWKEADEVERTFAAIRALPMQARESGRPIVLGPETRLEPADALELPAGWELHMEQPLTVRPNGLCSDASGTLVTTRQALPFEVAAPYCRVARLPAGGG